MHMEFIGIHGSVLPDSGRTKYQMVHAIWRGALLKEKEPEKRDKEKGDSTGMGEETTIYGRMEEDKGGREGE